MNIVLSVNRNFFLPAKVLIGRLKCLCVGNINVVVLHSTLDESQQNELESFSQEHFFVQCVFVDKLLVIDFPCTELFPPEACYRFLIPYLFDFDKALYLDCDILLLSSLEDFYATDIHDVYAVVCEDKSSGDINALKHISNLPLMEKNKYFNSGVMLLNVEKIRSEFDLLDFAEFAKSNKEYLIYPDQDILNCMFSSKVKWVDSRVYNYQISAEDISKISNARIIHFAGKSKPWNYKYFIDFSLFRSARTLYSMYWKAALSDRSMKRKQYAGFLCKRFFYRIKYGFNQLAKLRAK